MQRRISTGKQTGAHNLAAAAGRGVAFPPRDALNVRGKRPITKRTGEMPCSTFSTGRPG
jgi:hypothetical protein